MIKTAFAALAAASAIAAPSAVLAGPGCSHKCWGGAVDTAIYGMLELPF